jgi:hypothetical protein
MASVTTKVHQPRIKVPQPLTSTTLWRCSRCGSGNLRLSADTLNMRRCSSHPTQQQLDEKLSLGLQRWPQQELHSVGRAKAAQPASRLLYSKPPLESFTKVKSAQKAKPSAVTARGPVHRGLAAAYSGANSVVSALNLPRERDSPENPLHSNPNLSLPPSKQDISTWQGIEHFYLAFTTPIGCRLVDNEILFCAG